MPPKPIPSELPGSLPKARLRSNLLAWFDQNKRDLPWRRDRDPYRVWISEIMLQQTRVAAVIDHYQRFLRRFPTVESLAKARESSVLTAWSGLGYYRRARMLHQAAKQITKRNHGILPQAASDWRQLSGIGRYTAAAIASIAFEEPLAVVDGNVERVLQRLCGKTLAGETRWQLANQLLSRDRPGDFNQAMMELGATICLPQQPKCLLCPLTRMCTTRGELQNVGSGIRLKKKIFYALHYQDDAVFLVQRPRTATLMPTMWELPETNPPKGTSHPRFTLHHSITLTDYTVYVLEFDRVDGAVGTWVSKSRLTKVPLTGLARKILRAAQVI